MARSGDTGNKNRIEDAAEPGERPENREALVAKENAFMTTRTTARGQRTRKNATNHAATLANACGSS